MFVHKWRKGMGILLATVLFVSTSGIPVHRMICLCKGEMSVSLFHSESESCCRPAATGPDCCAENACSPNVHTQGHACQDHQTSLERVTSSYIGQEKEDMAQANFGPWLAFRPTDFFLGTFAGSGFVSVTPELPNGAPIYRRISCIRC